MSIIEVRSTPTLRSLSRRRKSDLIMMIGDLSQGIGRERPVIDVSTVTAHTLALRVLSLMREYPK